MQDKNYYQFNLDFQGKYIRGYKINETEHYFEISEPVFGFKLIDKITPIDNILHISKNLISCYFKIPTP